MVFYAQIGEAWEGVLVEIAQKGRSREATFPKLLRSSTNY